MLTSPHGVVWTSQEIPSQEPESLTGVAQEKSVAMNSKSRIVQPGLLDRGLFNAPLRQVISDEAINFSTAPLLPRATGVAMMRVGIYTRAYR